MSTSEGANDDHKAPRYSSTITSMASSFRGSQPTSMGPLAIEGPSRQEDAESQAPRHSSTMTSMASSFRGSQRTSIGPLAIEGPSRQEDAESQGFPALEAGKAEETLDPHFVNDFVEDPPIPLPETLWWLSLVACAVLGNVLAIGLEVDLGCLDCPLTPTVCQERSLECVEGEELPYRSSQWLLSDVVFTSFFVVDILVRVFSYGPKVFFKGVETKKKVIPFAVYNMLDVAVVCTRPADLIINLAGIAIPVRILSMVRVYQCLAVIKGLRKSSKSTLFTELWLIAKGAQNVMLTVVWVFVLMLLLVWAVACVLTLYVGHSDCIEEIEYGLVSTWTAQEYWGTVPRSVYTIFQILTLDRWASQIIWPVVKRLPAVSIIIFLFLCVGVLSLMSLIIGNIVENTITSSKENRYLLLMCYRTEICDESLRVSAPSCVFSTLRPVDNCSVCWRRPGERSHAFCCGEILFATRAANSPGSFELGKGSRSVSSVTSGDDACVMPRLQIGAASGCAELPNVLSSLVCSADA